MTSTAGIAVIGAYDSDVFATNVDELIALIPNPDTTDTSGAQAGGGNLDEMSAMAAAHLRVELAALKLGGSTGMVLAAGRYVAIAADATANQTDIVTGLADLTASEWAVTVWRAGVIVDDDAVITEPAAGTIRVADGATYVLTTGDVIIWAVIDAI